MKIFSYGIFTIKFLKIKMTMEKSWEVQTKIQFESQRDLKS